MSAAPVATAAKDYITKQGGLDAVIKQFEQNGLGEQVKSWVGTGNNLPVSAEQIAKALDSSGLAALAEKFGISSETIHAQLAEHLPQVVDQLTPNGKVEGASVAA